jgi:hypothetical protein
MTPVAELLETAGEIAYQHPTPWEDVSTRLAQGPDPSYWLATVREDGRSHQRPIWAEWVAGTLYFSSGNTLKSKHLARDPRCSIAIGAEGLDLVIEGKAHRVTDESELHRVRDRYADKGWAPTVRDEAFHDILGAPTAGPPPYLVYRIEPVVAYGFPHQETDSPTRWRF